MPIFINLDGLIDKGGKIGRAILYRSPESVPRQISHSGDLQFHFKLAMIQLKQALRNGPQIIKVSTLRGVTTYQFRKFSIRVRDWV
jgi:hypothetical protein